MAVVVNKYYPDLYQITLQSFAAGTTLYVGGNRTQSVLLQKKTCCTSEGKRPFAFSCRGRVAGVVSY